MLVGNGQGKIQLGRHWCLYDYDIKIDLGGKVRVTRPNDCTGAGYGPLTGFSEHYKILICNCVMFCRRQDSN
jgi:hypothetical protein